MDKLFAGKTYGAISHMLCAAYFSENGHKISIPIFDDSPYDLIVDDGKSLKRVQCKTAIVHREKRTGDQSKYSYPMVKLNKNSSLKHYFPSEFDLLWVVTGESAFLFPVEDLNLVDGHLAAFAISPKYNRYAVKINALSLTDPRQRQVSANLTDKEKDRVASLYLSGESVKGISTAMGLTDSQVEGYLLKNRILKAHVITEEIKVKVIDMYNSGKRVVDICNDLGFSRTAISNIVKGIKTRKVRIDPSWRTEILKMYRDGMSPTKIAEHFGTTRTAVSTFVFHNKWALESATSLAET